MPFLAKSCLSYFNTRAAIGLNVHDIDRLCDAFEGVPTGSGTELVGDIARVSRVGDSLGHEAIVDLLRIVQFVARRNSRGVEVRDPVDVRKLVKRSRQL